MIHESVDPYTDVQDAVLGDRCASPRATLLLQGHEAFRPWYPPVPPTARFLCTPTVLTDIARPELGFPAFVDEASA